MSVTSPIIGLQAGTSVDILRDIVQKRIVTLTYMRDVHEGRAHWFHTIAMTPRELERVFNNAAMKKRTYRFAVLGMSLGNLIDVHQPSDLLRGLLGTLTEFDSWKEDERPRAAMTRLFRPKLGKRTMTDYSDAPESSYLSTPSIPFPLDYRQTLLSLLDILSECYNKVARLLGPGAFPHHNGQGQMAGPLGLLSPHPGVSYLFSDGTPTGPEEGGSLWGIAHAQAGTPGAVYAHALNSPPPSWTPQMGEIVLKIDTRFKVRCNHSASECSTGVLTSM